MEEYDVVIVGAGFGGPVAAKKCAEAGLRTLMLERSQRVGEKVISGLTIPFYGFLFGTCLHPGRQPSHRKTGGRHHQLHRQGHRQRGHRYRRFPARTQAPLPRHQLRLQRLLPALLPVGSGEGGGGRGGAAYFHHGGGRAALGRQDRGGEDGERRGHPRAHRHRRRGLPGAAGHQGGGAGEISPGGHLPGGRLRLRDRQGRAGQAHGPHPAFLLGVGRTEAGPSTGAGQRPHGLALPRQHPLHAGPVPAPGRRRRPQPEEALQGVPRQHHHQAPVVEGRDRAAHQAARQDVGELRDLRGPGPASCATCPTTPTA